MVSGSDTHDLCIACLRIKHASTFIANPETCKHCFSLSEKTLQRRVRVAAIPKENPGLSYPPIVDNVEEAQSTTNLDCTEIIENESLELSTLV